MGTWAVRVGVGGGGQGGDLHPVWGEATLELLTRHGESSSETTADQVNILPKWNWKSQGMSSGPKVAKEQGTVC